MVDFKPLILNLRSQICRKLLLSRKLIMPINILFYMKPSSCFYELDLYNKNKILNVKQNNNIYLGEGVKKKQILVKIQKSFPCYLE